MTQCNELSINYLEGYDPEESGFHPSVVQAMQYLSGSGGAKDYQYSETFGAYAVFVPRDECNPGLWSALKTATLQPKPLLFGVKIHSEYAYISDGIWVKLYPNEIHGDSDGLP